MSPSTRSPEIASYATATDPNGRNKPAANLSDSVDGYRRVDEAPESRPVTTASADAAADPDLILLIHGTFAGCFAFALAAALGSNATLDLRSDQEVGLRVAVFRAPLLTLVEWAGVPLLITDSGMRLGSYDPSTGRSLFEYMFFTWEGWVISG